MDGLKKQGALKSKARYQNPEMIIALTALLVGIVTAFTSIYSAYVDREYARASVWPRLEVFRSYNDTEFSYGVANRGTGPALIKYAAVQYKSQYIARWQDIDEVFGDSDAMRQTMYSQSHIGEITIPAGETVIPIQIRGASRSAFAGADKHINFELCYCSIYQECWVTTRANQPTEVASCVVNKEQRFLQ